MDTQNIILVGMPGSGKSTVGVVIAKRMGYRFLDSDLLIQEQYGRRLHELIDRHGIDGFHRLENDVNASISAERTIIATGGSAVYGAGAMEHLGRIGTIVYLQLSCETIEERLGDLHERGVTLKPGQTLRELYEERIPLYEKYADVTIACDGLCLREVVDRLWDIFRT